MIMRNIAITTFLSLALVAPVLARSNPPTEHAPPTAEQERGDRTTPSTPSTPSGPQSNTEGPDTRGSDTRGAGDTRRDVPRMRSDDACQWPFWQRTWVCRE